MRSVRNLALVLILPACLWAQTPPKTATHKPATQKLATSAASGNPVAVFDTTAGKLRCALFEKQTPVTVANFIALATGTKDWTNPVSHVTKHNTPLYDGTIFHRVIPEFMIQGGDPAGNGMGGPGYQFEDETRNSPHKFDKKGKLAMANAGPNTNGSQFFITVAPTTWLTGKHTIFGEVVEGQDVVDKISNVARGHQDRPVKDVVLQSVTIERV
jgi:peptidyl-prolyl cis-trans isomerase A (cyclophilin A)